MKIILTLFILLFVINGCKDSHDHHDHSQHDHDKKTDKIKNMADIESELATLREEQKIAEDLLAWTHSQLKKNRKQIESIDLEYKKLKATYKKEGLDLITQKQKLKEELASSFAELESHAKHIRDDHTLLMDPIFDLEPIKVELEKHNH